MDIGQIASPYNLGTDRLLDALLSEDDVGAVIRCHFEIEKALDYLIAGIAPGIYNPQKFNNRFADKIEVAAILGLHENFLAPMRTLNKLRNALAHRGKDKITDQDGLDFVRQARRALAFLKDDFTVEFKGKRAFRKTLAECTVRERYVATALVFAANLSAIPAIAKSGEAPN